MHTRELMSKPRRPGLWPLCCALACAQALTQAQAAAPLATDDAEVLAARDCEAEPSVQRLSLGDRTRETTLNVQLACGLGHGTQAAVAWGRSSQPDAQNRGRRESVALGLKTALDMAPQGLGLALSAGSVMGRAGSEPFRFDSLYVSAAVTAALRPGVTGHANLGWVRSRPGGSSSTAWNLALEVVCRPGLDAAVELYGDDRSRPWLGLGLRWTVSEQLKLGASHAVQADTLRQRLVSVGVTWGF
jgi:hypothetical protein